MIEQRFYMRVKEQLIPPQENQLNFEDWMVLSEYFGWLTEVALVSSPGLELSHVDFYYRPVFDNNPFVPVLASVYSGVMKIRNLAVVDGGRQSTSEKIAKRKKVLSTLIGTAEAIQYIQKGYVSFEEPEFKMTRDCERLTKMSGNLDTSRVRATFNCDSACLTVTRADNYPPEGEGFYPTKRIGSIWTDIEDLDNCACYSMGFNVTTLCLKPGLEGKNNVVRHRSDVKNTFRSFLYVKIAEGDRDQLVTLQEGLVNFLGLGQLLTSNPVAAE